MESHVDYIIESFSIQAMTDEDFNAYKFMPNDLPKNFSFKDKFLEMTGYNPGSKEGNRQLCKQCGKSGPECISHPVILDLAPLGKMFISEFGIKTISEISKVICRKCKKVVHDKEGKVTDIKSLAKLSSSRKRCSDLEFCPTPTISEVKEEKLNEKRQKYQKRDTNPKKMTGDTNDLYELIKEDSVVLPEYNKKFILGLFFNKLVMKPASIHQMNFVPGTESNVDEITGMIKLYESIYYSMNYYGTPDEEIKKKITLIFIGDSENGFTGTPSYLSIMDGKEGLVRNDGINKRTLGTGRAVVSSSTRRCCEVQAPSYIMKNLQSIIRVKSYNREKLQKKVGITVTHLVTDMESSSLNKRKNFIRLNHNTVLKEGDIVLKILEDGEFVNISRHPVLWRHSLMSYRAFIREGENSITLAGPNTVPLNADFDGDELNSILSALLGARIESESMNSKYNHFGPHNGNPLIGISYNGIIGAYIISSELDIEEKFFNHLVEIIEGKIESESDVDNYIRDFKIDRDYYNKMATAHGIGIRSGRILFSMLLPRNLNYKRDDVVIKNGIFVEGYLKKIDVADKIITQISYIDPYRLTYLFVDRGYAMLSEYISSRGVTISAEDYIMPGELRKQVECPNFEEEFKKLEEKVDSLEKIKLSQTKTVANETENKIIRLISKFEKSIMDVFMTSDYRKRNIALVSYISGARGNIGNIISAVTTIGQQYNGSDRLGLNERRISPYSKPGAKDLVSRGFIFNSYCNGKSMHEDFISAGPARKSAIAVQSGTPEAGDASRQTTMNLNGLITDNSLALINRGGNVVDPLYGCGNDPAKIRNQDVKKNKINSSVDILQIMSGIA